jgi:hypothetical protein
LFCSFIADPAEAAHLLGHLDTHHPLDGHRVDQVLRRGGGEDRIEAIGAAPHVDRRS